MSKNKAEMSRSLHHAIYSGNYKEVERMIGQGVNVNKPDENDNTPLHIAAKGADFEMVKLLVSCKAKVNRANRQGITPILYACQRDSTQIIEYLLEHGAKLRVRTKKGNGALHYAAKGGARNAIKLLIEKKRLSPVPIHKGENRGKNESINALGYNALMMAARHGRLEVVQYLVTLGLSLYEENYEGNNAFLVAAAHGHLPVVKFLLTRDKSLLKIDNKLAMNALMLAVESGSSDTIRYLIDQGINLCVKNIEDDTAFDIASGSEHPSVSLILEAAQKLMLLAQGDLDLDQERLSSLLTSGASVNQRMHEDHLTPLHLAVIKGNVKLARGLLDLGADPLQRAGFNKEGPNAFELAETHQSAGALVHCLLHTAWAAIRVNDEKKCEEEIAQAFLAISSLKQKTIQCEAYLILGLDLKNELKRPKHAYKAFMSVKKGSQHHEAAQQELAELFLVDQLHSVDALSLQEEDIKASSETNLERALRFSLSAGHSDQSKQMRSRITNSLLGLSLNETSSFADLATEDGVLQLLQQHKKLRDDFNQQKQELAVLMAKQAVPALQAAEVVSNRPQKFHPHPLAKRVPVTIIFSIDKPKNDQSQGEATHLGNKPTQTAPKRVRVPIIFSIGEKDCVQSPGAPKGEPQGSPKKTAAKRGQSDQIPVDHDAKPDAKKRRLS